MPKLVGTATTTPSTQAFGDAAAVGTTGTEPARGDHKHAMPAAAVTASGLTMATGRILGRTTASTGAPEEITVGSGLSLSGGSLTATGSGERAASSTTPAAVGTAAIGVGTTDARADHVHATGAGTPSTQAFGDAATTGSGPAASMTDHKHAMPALGTTAAAIGTSAGGSAVTPSKSDHVHATGAGTPSTQAFGDAAATGTGPAASMTDHKHAMPANPVTAHEAAADPHTGYRLESADHTHASTGLQGGTIAYAAITGTPTLPDLPGHVAAADPHTGYVREADTSWVDLTDGGATTLHSHAGGTTTQVSLASGVASDYVARAKLTADTQYRVQVGLDSASAGQLLFGAGGATAPDANLYRSAANVLKTDDQFTATNIITANVGGGSTSVQVGTDDGGGRQFAGITFGADTDLYRDSAQVLATDGGLRLRQSSTTDIALMTKVNAESLDRMYIDAAGTHQWGGGSAVPDIRLRRGVAGRLVLDTNGGAVATEFGMESTSGRRAKMDMRVTGDTFERTAVWGDATLAGMTFGPGGGSSTDTTLARAASATLYTNGTFYQQGAQTGAVMNGGTTNDYALTAGATQLRLENLPLTSGVSAALATPVIASTTDGTSFSTAAWSPVVGQEYLIFIGVTKGTTPDNPNSFTKTGLTFGGQYTVLNNLTRLYVIPAVGTATTSSVFTVGFAAAQTGCFIGILALTGNHTLSSVFAGGDQTVYNNQVAPIANAGGQLGYVWKRGRFTIGFAAQEAAVAPATDAGYTSYASTTIATPNEGFSLKSNSGAGGGVETGTMAWSTTLTGTGVATIIGVPPASAGPASITGFTGGAQGRTLVITNSSENEYGDPRVYTADDDAIILKHENSGSSASNRIQTPQHSDYVIAAGATVHLFYDTSVNRWRVLTGTRAPNVITYLSGSGTYTPSPGISHVVVEVLGGGGGGGSATSVVTAGHGALGGSGGGGGYARKLLPVSQLGGTVSYAVSAGGAPAGGGGASTFSGPGFAAITANGGVQGAANGDSTADRTGGSPGAGGSASGGDVNVIGGFGQSGVIWPSQPRVATGYGGGTFLGPGADILLANAAGGAAGVNAVANTGGGGSGGYALANATVRAGGSGGSGLIIVTEYYS